MRIAFLNKYQNKVFRGAETFVFELAKRLSKNHHVDIIADINYLDLLKKRYDIIIPTNGRFQVILVRIISWLSGAKMIVSGQSGVGWDDKVNLLTFPDTFVALSERAKVWAKRFNPFVKVVKIPNGVDLSKFIVQGQSLRVQSLHVNLKKPIVLAVGAFTEQKRLDLAIDAVSRLENVKLIIAGGGGEIREKITDYGLKRLGKDRFEVLSVPFEKMPEVYRAADVFTLPSKPSEAFGNVLVEAMASGLPVVATDDPIRREIVGDAGIFTDPKDTKSYAKAISDSLERNWGETPRSQAEKFSWDKIADKYEALFKEIGK